MVATPLTALLLSGSPYPLPQGDLLDTALSRFAAIPYENLTKIVGVHEAQQAVLKQTPEEVLRGFLLNGTGGTCFPLTLTLVEVLREFGLQAHPILADRRYGTDTHCAVLAEIEPGTWSIIDPGYLITRPLPLPVAAPLRASTGFSVIELRPQPSSARVDLFTITESGQRYRLTYKAIPVDLEQFHRAWDASFAWEMMTYPVVSGVREGEQIYVQRDNVTVKSLSGSVRTALNPEALACEISRKLGLSLPIVRKAFSILGGMA